MPAAFGCREAKTGINEITAGSCTVSAQEAVPYERGRVATTFPALPLFSDEETRLSKVQ